MRSNNNLLQYLSIEHDPTILWRGYVELISSEVEYFSRQTELLPAVCKNSIGASQSLWPLALTKNQSVEYRSTNIWQQNSFRVALKCVSLSIFINYATYQHSGPKFKILNGYGYWRILLPISWTKNPRVEWANKYWKGETKRHETNAGRVLIMLNTTVPHQWNMSSHPCIGGRLDHDQHSAVRGPSTTPWEVVGR